MNIKDYTLKIGYRIGGKCKEESVEYALVKNGGYDGEDIRICDFGDADHVKIVVNAKSKIELTLAELIYDRYFENNERFFANGFQSWTSTREYKKRDVQYGLRSLSKLRSLENSRVRRAITLSPNTAKICTTASHILTSARTKKWSL